MRAQSLTLSLALLLSPNPPRLSPHSPLRRNPPHSPPAPLLPRKTTST